MQGKSHLQKRASTNVLNRNKCPRDDDAHDDDGMPTTTTAARRMPARMPAKKAPARKVLAGERHGSRLFSHCEEALRMSPVELHDAYPWTADLAFNETMRRGDPGFDEATIPDEMCIFGSKASNVEPRNIGPRGLRRGQLRTAHHWVIGNDAGEILPYHLYAAFVAIESGVDQSIHVRDARADDDERARMYAIVREAQARAIAPFDLRRNPIPPQPWAEIKPSSAAKQQPQRPKLFSRGHRSGDVQPSRAMAN